MMFHAGYLRLEKGFGRIAIVFITAEIEIFIYK